jgi:hypothetical protein
MSNNVVEADFAGNTGQPAVFAASALTPGLADQTTISGVVLDNSNQPIPNVTIRMFRVALGFNNALPMEIGTPVITDNQGTFRVTNAPVGIMKLMADGSTSLPSGAWPTLEYDLLTVAGRDNTVGMPIYLPRLDQINRLCVSQTTGGILTLPQVPGFSLTVAPGAATFPGGARTGCISVTPVNPDKVPMAPGFGQQPRFVVTVQPVGTTFNPPARIQIPNVDGLAPRAKTEMYSYDHDLAAFVAIGTGTVSEDASVIASDAGVGVIKAGWHCGGNPNPTASAGTCPECYRCRNGTCVADNSQRPQTDCKECRNGNVVNASNGVNRNTAGSCCFDGQTVANVGNSYDDLLGKCPSRVQSSTRAHEIDGCSNSPDDPTALNYGPFLLAQSSTAFGSVEGTLPVGQHAPGVPLACNWHDICYQTCGSVQDSCDRDLQTRALLTCDSAYPEPNPYALLNPLHLAYIAQRGFCRTAADTYYSVLSLAGGAAYRERQSQYCNCCSQ